MTSESRPGHESESGEHEPGTRDVIPLFPLRTLLVPGLVIPLHIFEDRYRLMMRTLLDSDEQVFGIIAIHTGREVDEHGVDAVYDVGTTATLMETEELDGGGYDITAVGTQRFRLHELDRTLPYLQGHIEYIGEREGDAPQVLAGSVLRAFARYRAVLTGAELSDDVAAVAALEMSAHGLPDDPTVLSYLVSAAIVADLPQRQALLESPDTSSRLRAELELLSRETTLVRTLSAVPAVELFQRPIYPN